MSVYEVLFQIGLFAMCFFGGGFFVSFTIAFIWAEVMPTFAAFAAKCIRPLLVSVAWTVAAAILNATVTP